MTGAEGGPGPEPVAVERLADSSRVVAVLDELWDGAVHEVRCTLPGGPYPDDFLREHWEDDQALLRRGVALRSLCGLAAVQAPEGLRYFAEWAATGVQVRTTGRPMQRMIVVDAEAAVIPAVVDADGGPALLVREPAMVDSLIRQFDALWDSAHVIGDDSPQALRVTEIREILQLLSEGLTDEAVARRLRLSHRTVQRRVGAAMALMGTSSRFAAGVRAAALGWL
ncbi:hypothetical protein JL107_07205 [Nakamurella flavida]|uniref:HTH luxR-type domain-containing protein n=1 Tax=Nakamurella flavida TaxID=363630 RepID=A0A938YNC7_9ACTN|nr:LuxR C-terminal-related transcriptional regulator [Nakamurella flavida]MBM9476228.1 hypothetical protein [Nakamurella flavida]MDP9779674.1 DNA-binding CsgD family transcriptional regulator [Nakamurella flavida]